MDPKQAAYRDLARRLLERESGPDRPTVGPAVGERVCARLQEELAKLVGAAGFAAVWQRALYLARPSSPLLQGIHTNGEACLTGFAERSAGQASGEVTEALVSLFGQFLWLLSTFIGDDLVLRQVRRIWPELSLDEAAAGMEEAVQ